ncbi:MAG: glutamate 5-kinase, partial [Thermoguttaceae bacterium]|nr:glutamate 5-kinase [Thermoguttaceae bacterium]
MSNEYPVSPLRQEVIVASKTIVVKVGSRCLTDANRHLDHQQIKNLVDQLYEIILTGRRVILVSSGAVAAGMDRLMLTSRPKDLGRLQAVAAVGQSALIEAYNRYLAPYNIPAAQALLTNDDMKNRTRYLNMRNTLNAALDFQTLPIINENDSLAVAEIKVGDNDKLSSDVALFLDADLLLIFTDEDGLFDDNPKKNPNARLLNFVPEITPAILALAGKPGEAGSAVSTGGMRSKLEAIRNVTKSGANAFLASGMKVLPHQVFFENATGTLFAGSKKKLNSRQR